MVEQQGLRVVHTKYGEIWKTVKMFLRGKYTPYSLIFWKNQKSAQFWYYCIFDIVRHF